MFNLFKRKKKTPETSPLQDKLVNGIVGKVTAFQFRWAYFMQRNSERFSLRTKKYFTIIIVLLASLYSLYIIASSIIQKPKKGYSISKIHVPKYTTKTGEEKTLSNSLIPEKEYYKIIRFHQYIDSLNQTTKGKRIADSILLKRPGLMDSTFQLKKLYELQQSLKE
ncbi:MAG: hypothetical protein JST86_12400 [Bacteroidetes bacterium]|nr:hypothetical protein [Bacteroidota bacterium]